MKNNMKRFLSLVLVIVMTLSCVPMQALAEGEEVAVTSITKEGATFAVNFKADNVSAEMLEKYGTWTADFELTFNSAITLNGANPTDNSYVSVLYPAMTVVEWMDLPGDVLSLQAGNAWGIFAYMNTLNDMPAHTFSAFRDAADGFSYAVALHKDYLAANPYVNATVELVLTNPENSAEKIVVASYKYGKEAPALPTATTTPIGNKDLTFAMNFTADAVTEEQLAYYGDWYADFELTINEDVTFNANGTGDGWLSGRYDAWNNGAWVNVPVEPVTIKADEPLRIMEFAAKLLGQDGLRMTGKEILSDVKSFDCGVYFTPEFLEAHPDLEVNLELKMCNPADETESYQIGEQYTFDQTMPALPTATVSKVGSKDLTFAMNFKADQPSAAQLAYYGDWYADFVLTVNKNVTFDANGTGDGYLSGRYEAWNNGTWVNVPVEPVEIKANEPLRIMEFASKLLSNDGLKMTYSEMLTAVKEFDCGVFFTEEFLADNEDLEVTLELRLYNPDNTTENYVIGEKYVFDQSMPALPTASATRIDNKDLTFAMNFKADEITEEQLAYFDEWYADFELTVNKKVVLDAEGSGDGYLSGSYDAWQNGAWVNVPFNGAVTLNANEPLKIMAFAAEYMGEPDLKYTCGEVYEVVKDFDCGMYFTPAFLAANPDLEVTLELRMYNPANEAESYVIGETYVYNTDHILPTATATPLEIKGLTYAMNFKADEVTEGQLAYFEDWYADFELTVNKDVVLDAEETGDGYLSGRYEAWQNDTWVNVPFNGAVTLKANEPLKIMAFAAEYMGEPGLKYTYGEVYELVKDFDCGMFFDTDFLKSNPDLEVKLELKMYNPANEAESYVVGQTHIFKNDFVAYNINTRTTYSKVSDAMGAAEPNETVILIRNAEDEFVFVKENNLLDLNGYTLKADYVSSFGNMVDTSYNNGGYLQVSSEHILINKQNSQLPVLTANGYQFVQIVKFEAACLNEGNKFAFLPRFEPYAHELLKDGTLGTDVSIKVRLSWTNADGSSGSQDFVYSSDMVKAFIESYDGTTYGKMFTLTVTGVENISNLTFTAVVRSDTNVEITSETLPTTTV